VICACQVGARLRPGFSTGHVFAQRYKALVVDRDNYLLQVSRYIHKKRMIPGLDGLTEIVQRVCEVTGIEKEELRRAAREARIQRGREIFSSVARRYSEASLRESVPYLGARDPSMVSHGVRRAEARLQEDRTFRQQMERIVEKLVHSSIQA